MSLVGGEGQPPSPISPCSPLQPHSPHPLPAPLPCGSSPLPASTGKPSWGSEKAPLLLQGCLAGHQTPLSTTARCLLSGWPWPVRHHPTLPAPTRKPQPGRAWLRGESWSTSMELESQSRGRWVSAVPPGSLDSKNPGESLGRQDKGHHRKPGRSCSGRHFPALGSQEGPFVQVGRLGPGWP